jgi:4'-phosphopantetheinyl transferase
MTQESWEQNRNRKRPTCGEARRHQNRTLVSDEVDVWWMATDAVRPADLREWFEVLDEEERGRSARFCFEADQRDYIAAHVLLRSMLAWSADCPAEEWRFARDANGKPRVFPGVGLPEIEFNLSHTRGLVAAAATRSGAIGIDAERVDPAKADLAVAERFFAPLELRILHYAPAADRTKLFFRLWTLKEAYIKAIGTGLSMPLDSFTFAFEPLRIEFGADAPGRPQDWQFAIPPTTDEHVLSVALGCPADAARFSLRTVAPREL